MDETNLQKIKKLKHLKFCYINWSEESSALVYRIENVYILFEIPLFGGEPRYSGTFQEGDEDNIIKIVDRWL